jgi:fatty-acyl-CoA synthase
MVKGIGSWLVNHKEKNPDKLVVISNDKRFTYREFNFRVNKLANALLDNGVRKGDRINTLLFNTSEQLETMFACAKIGAIFVPINYRLSAKEVVYIIQDSSSSHLVYDEKLANLVSEVRTNELNVREYIFVGNESCNDINYEDYICEASDCEPDFPIDLEDVHMMMYTSGTTGRPKGAMLTHGNTLWNAINATQILPFVEEDSTLTVAPLFHIGGMSTFTTPLIYKGGTIILDEKFDPQRTLELIEQEKITTLFLVPAMWLALTQVPNFNDYDLSSLRLNCSGGASCPITVIEFFQQRNIPFFEGFGMTETAPVVAVLDAKNSRRKNGSVGKPPMHTEVRVVDPNDRDVPVGETGELIIKGPNILKGYWNNPEATRKSIKDGWFYSGDLARFDDEGFLYIVDRKKDMLITGGENVYPVEVEQVLFKHPNIKEVAVVGVPDEKWGESVKAYIVLKDPSKTISIEAIRQYCEGKLARFKHPKFYEILEELPRNATGKVLKTILRSEKKLV